MLEIFSRQSRRIWSGLNTLKSYGIAYENTFFTIKNPSHGYTDENKLRYCSDMHTEVVLLRTSATASDLKAMFI